MPRSQGGLLGLGSEAVPCMGEKLLRCRGAPCPSKMAHGPAWAGRHAHTTGYGRAVTGYCGCDCVHGHWFIFT